MKVLIPKSIRKIEDSFQVMDAVTDTHVNLPSLHGYDMNISLENNSLDDICYFIINEDGLSRLFNVKKDQKAIWCSAFIEDSFVYVLKKEFETTLDFTVSRDDVINRVKESFSIPGTQALLLCYDGVDRAVIDSADLSLKEDFVELSITPLLRFNTLFFTQNKGITRSLVFLKLSSNIIDCVGFYANQDESVAIEKNSPSLASEDSQSPEKIGFERFFYSQNLIG